MKFRPSLLASLVVLSFAALPALGAGPITAGPPPTAVKPVSDTYFGTTVIDPYRWLENLSDPAVQAWFKAQNTYTSAVLATLDPARARLRNRIAELSRANERVAGLDREGDYFFYLKRPADASNYRLYVRPMAGGAERILFNPETYGDGKTHWSLGTFNASPDGRYVGIFIYPGGSEVGMLNVIETATGKTLPDSIDRMLYGFNSWRADGRSFFYTRLQEIKPGMTDADREQNQHTFVHVLGQSVDHDIAIAGHDVSPAIPVTPSQVVYLAESAASPYTIAILVNGVQNEWSIYAAPSKSVTGSNVAWQKVVDFSDQVTNAGQIGKQLYVLDHKQSSRFGVDVIDLAHPGARMQPFIEPSNVVIRAFTLAADGLYTNDLDGGVYRMRRKGFAAGAATESAALPFLGAISGLDSDPRYPGVLFQLEGWTQAPAWYRAGGTSSSDIANLNLVAKPSVDFSDYVAEEVQAKSYDGTMVPLSILHRKDIALDGSHPALLDGYGAYGIVQDPGFAPRYLALLERGAVYAVAHVRGGGEYGEDWHLGGQKLNKKNTWLDFNACAQYLIDHKYTSSKHLAATGGSAGGITVGRAITTDPALFAAAIIDVGWEDPLRIEQERNGPANVPEFGSTQTADGFRSLYEMDSYLHVKDGTSYPAVLFTTGINDRRVAPWHPAKMTARLQAASKSGKPILLRVDYDLGHSQGATKEQINDLLGDSWSFMLWQTGDPAFQPGAQKTASR